jgi:hypothetical protein
MARKLFQIKYQDGSRKHVKAEERDNLLLAGLLKTLGPREYEYIGQPKTFHSFADLGNLQLIQPGSFRRFLPGSFVIEFQGKRTRELLETPEQMAFRGTMESVNS